MIKCSISQKVNICSFITVHPKFWFDVLHRMKLIKARDYEQSLNYLFLKRYQTKYVFRIRLRYLAAGNPNHATHIDFSLWYKIRTPAEMPMAFCFLRKASHGLINSVGFCCNRFLRRSVAYNSYRRFQSCVLIQMIKNTVFVVVRIRHTHIRFNPTEKCPRSRYKSKGSLNTFMTFLQK